MNSWEAHTNGSLSAIRLTRGDAMKTDSSASWMAYLTLKKHLVWLTVGKVKTINASGYHYDLILLTFGIHCLLRYRVRQFCWRKLDGDEINHCLSSLSFSLCVFLHFLASFLVNSLPLLPSVCSVFLSAAVFFVSSFHSFIQSFISNWFLLFSFPSFHPSPPPPTPLSLSLSKSGERP